MPEDLEQREKDALLDQDLFESLQEYILCLEGLTGPCDQSHNGMEMVVDKVQAILGAQTPDSAGAVSLFLGYANFYRRFIHHFAAKAIPLYELTKKDAKFV